MGIKELKRKQDVLRDEYEAKYAELQEQIQALRHPCRIPKKPEQPYHEQGRDADLRNGNW